MSHANISGKVCRKLAGVEIDESRKRKAERIEEAVAGAGRPKKKTKKSDDGWARRQVLRQLRHDLDPEVEEGPDEQRHHPLQRVRAQEEEARKGEATEGETEAVHARGEEGEETGRTTTIQEDACREGVAQGGGSEIQEDG